MQVFDLKEALFAWRSICLHVMYPYETLCRVLILYMCVWLAQVFWMSYVESSEADGYHVSPPPSPLFKAQAYFATKRTTVS